MNKIMVDKVATLFNCTTVSLNVDSLESVSDYLRLTINVLLLISHSFHPENMPI